MGTVEGVYYSGGNSVLAFKHEPFHVGDNDDDRYTVSTGLSNSQLNRLEARAVGFQNYLSNVYGLNQTRHQYGQRLKKDPLFYRFMGSNEKIRDFQRTKMNNEKTKFGFSYMKNDRKRFITITYDKK